jgi:hypothetical protein
MVNVREVLRAPQDLLAQHTNQSNNFFKKIFFLHMPHAHNTYGSPFCSPSGQEVIFFIN